MYKYFKLFRSIFYLYFIGILFFYSYNYNIRTRIYNNTILTRRIRLFTVVSRLNNLFKALTRDMLQDPEAGRMYNVILELLESKYKDMQIEAAMMISNLPKEIKDLLLPLVSDVLVEFTKDSEWYICRNAIGALGNLGIKDKKVISRLIELTRDGNEFVRESAARSLGQLGIKDKRVISRLIELTRDGNEFVRESAARSLGQLGIKDKEVIDALIELTKSSNNEYIRRNAAEALGQLGIKDKEVIDALIKLTEDSEWFVCESAAKALGKLGVVVDKKG